MATAAGSHDDEQAELERALAMSLQPLEDARPAAAQPGDRHAAGSAASSDSSTSTPVPESVTKALETVVWGSFDDMPAEVLDRWLQGFTFSADEPTALVQRQGGPCGVLAPVQGFLLRFVLFPNGVGPVQADWRQTQAPPLEALVAALACVLRRAAGPNKPVTLVHPGAELAASGLNTATIRELHHSMAQQTVTSQGCELEAALRALLPSLQSRLGVVCFLYSALLSRKLSSIENDLGLDQEPLVSCPFGHANQSLINLLLVGVATPHVFDGNRDLGGMIMFGIEKQGCIGYLTLIEALKYCEVGSFLKNPEFPIWVVGSESHMTVLFSEEHRLVAAETPASRARRIFTTHDREGNGFVTTDKLPALLRDLGPPFASMNVAELTPKMDGDGLGIILLPKFIGVLFPDATETGIPREFDLLHYNGIAKPGGKVVFVKGKAKCEIPRDFGSTPILQAMRTKWTALELEWEGNATPSIT
eukprot:m.170361 g.170361  ORF g.170361 m.170361 type:complete len:476 (-) comp17826_c0_seq5:118-1545(-)